MLEDKMGHTEIERYYFGSQICKNATCVSSYVYYTCESKKTKQKYNR